MCVMDAGRPQKAVEKWKAQQMWCLLPCRHVPQDREAPPWTVQDLRLRRRLWRTALVLILTRRATSLGTWTTGRQQRRVRRGSHHLVHQCKRRWWDTVLSWW